MVKYETDGHCLTEEDKAISGNLKRRIGKRVDDLVEVSGRRASSFPYILRLGLRASLQLECEFRSYTAVSHVAFDTSR